MIPKMPVLSSCTEVRKVNIYNNKHKGILATYQVKIRHSKVDIKMRTWLNIADCVRWMAL